MDAFAFILALFVAARVLGRLAQRLHQPASVGEVLAGAGIAVMLAAWPGLAPSADGHGAGPGGPLLAGLAQAGVFVLLLRAGVEMAPSELLANSRASLLVALGGSLVPLAAGGAFAWAVLPESDLKPAQALILATGLAISAVPVAAKVLLEFGLLHKRVGEVILAAAVFDDVLALVLLAAIAGMVAGTPITALGLLGLVTQVAVFFVVTGVAGRVAIPRLWPWLHRHGTGMTLSGLLVLAGGFGLLAEALGLHAILGPFVAGLFFEQAQVGKRTFEQAKHVLDALAFGVLAPLFFASIGLRLDLGAVQEAPLFLAALLAIAFAGKILGAGAGAQLAGLGPRESLAIGVGMSGRGAIEIVVADLALRAGALEPPPGGDPVVDNLFSALVITAIATTVVTPWLLRRVLGRDPKRIGGP